MSPEWNGNLLSVVLDASVRVALIAAIVALILVVARVRSNDVRHAAWTAVLCAMLLMPVLPYCVPSISLPPVPVPTAGIQAILEIPEATSPSGATLRAEVFDPAPVPEILPSPSADAGAASGHVWPAIVLVLYGTGLLVLLSRLLLGWRSMSRIARMSAPVALEAGIRPNLPPCTAPVCESVRRPTSP